MQRTRVIGIAAVIVLLTGVVAARLCWMQGFRWRDYRAMADRTRRSTDFSSARRGRIVDARGRVLAEDVPDHRVMYSLEGIVKTRWVARRVGRLLRDADGVFPYDEDRLFESLEDIRQKYGARLVSGLPLEPEPWVLSLTAEQATQLRAAVESPVRAPYYPGLFLDDDGNLAIRPRELFAGEVGIRRLEHQLRIHEPDRDVGDLYTQVAAAYREMREPVLGLRRQLEDVKLRLEGVEQLGLDSKSRAALRKELWSRRDWLSAKIDDIAYHRKIRQRLYEKERLLVDEIPFEIVCELVENPGRYPGLTLEETRDRVASGGVALTNLLGTVAGRTAELDQTWRERGEPVLDSWYAHHGRLKRLSDARLFRALRLSAHHSEDRVGVAGLEKMLEPQLRGTPGARNFEVDVRGRPRGGPLWSEPPVPGRDCRLTLDAELCSAIYDMTDRAEPSVFGASVLVGDPRTGEIHGWVSYPSLDPELKFESEEELESFYRANPGILLNRPVSSQVEPGSTFKTVVAIAGLAEGVIGPDDGIECDGFYNPAKRDQLRCGNHSIPKTLAVREALARSCNCYFYRLGGDRLGAEKIREWGRRLHLWDREGNGLDVGRSWGDPPTQRGNRPLLGIGRSFTVRPIGIFRLTCGIANRGLFVPARLVAGASAPPPHQVEVEPWVWDAVIEGMVGAVQYGTASHVEVGLSRFDCAVKTGTAESRWRDEAGNLVIGNTAWLIGFAPVQHPQVAFVINVERAPDQMHGGEACGHIAAAVLEWYRVRRGFSTERPR